MQVNNSIVEQAKNVDMPTNLYPFWRLDSTVTHGSIAVAIILALAVLIKALAALVKSCQD